MTDDALFPAEEPASPTPHSFPRGSQHDRRRTLPRGRARMTAGGAAPPPPPAPAEFGRAYHQLLDAGPPGVVSVHLPAGLSGPYDPAVLAAADFGGGGAGVAAAPAGMGLGFVALAAYRTAAAGA